MKHSEEYEKILKICLNNPAFNKTDKDKLVKELDFLEEQELLKGLWSLLMQRKSTNNEK